MAWDTIKRSRWLRFYEEYEAERSFFRAMKRIDPDYDNTGITGLGYSGIVSLYGGDLAIARPAYNLWLKFYRRSQVIKIRTRSERKKIAKEAHNGLGHN